MKKLNITKEQFNRSKYFQRKYGELEYVSESGKVFKTNKGKVLMFREHHDPEGFTKNPEIQKLSKKVLSKMKRMRKMLDEWDVPIVSEKYKLGGNRIEITLKAGRDDSVYSIGGGRVLTLYVETGHSGWGISITADEQISYPYLFRGEDDVIEVFNVFLNQFSRDFDDYIAELDRDEMDNAYTESKKFGKMFKTDKGKVLMFKEYTDGYEGLERRPNYDVRRSPDWGGQGCTAIPDGSRFDPARETRELIRRQIKDGGGVVIRRTNKLGDLWTIQTHPENPRDSIKIVQNIKGLNKARKYAKDHHWKVIGTIPRNPEGVKESTRKFNESIKDIAPGIQDWGTTVYIEELGAELDWKDVYDFVKADCRLYPLLEQDIGVEPYEEPSDKQIRKWIKTKPESFIDYLKEFGYYDYANGKDNDDLEYESKRKSSRKPVNESTSGVPEFLNVERFRQEITEILQEEADSWVDDETGSMKYNAEEFIDEYVDGVVQDTVESFNELVHREDTSMPGNFKNIKYNWEGFHNELPHGCTLKEVVQMIDAGEENEITKEFKDWAVDWYFEAFGTYNLKYNWTDFISELAYNDEEEEKRWNDQED